MSEAVPETPPAPPPPAPPAAPTVKPWPEWFAPFDIALAILVLVPAFLVASHAARNSDVWPTLAAGRLISEGGYSFGVDPFSYATAGRYWVNHAWLSGTVGYQLLKADPTGAVLVGVKAALFALAFGLGLVARKPGQSVWPGVVFALLGVVAAAPHSGLRPLVLSAPFLAATLLVLLRADWSRGGWRNQIILGGLFALWVNCDAWFLLGPLAVLLMLIGELLQKQFRGDGANVGPLAKALAVGVFATLLNPHHVRAWQAPVELGIGVPVIVTAEPLFKQQFLSPASKDYTGSPAYGYTPNGLAFAVLLGAGGLVLAAAAGKLRFGYVLLWLGFAALALVQVRLILFFAVAAGPLAAAAAGAAFASPGTGTAADVLRWLGSLGRLMTLPAVLMLGVLAYPGWLHPRTNQAANTPWVEWAVVPDPGTVRTAQQFAEWRKAGKIPADAHGLHLDPAAANLFAYFAPEEKVFANTRFAFHAAELPDLIKARRVLYTGRSADDGYDLEGLTEVCDTVRAGYVAYGPLQPGAAPDLTPAQAMMYATKSWQLWHADGRAVVLGRPGQAGPVFDPIRMAFDPAQKPTPAGTVGVPTVPPTEWAEKMFYRPKAPPPEVNDAVVWHTLARAAYQRRAPLAGQIRGFGAAAFASSPAALFTGSIPLQADDDLYALELLAIRAARAATAVTTDAAEPYYVLSEAYAPSELQLPGVQPAESAAQEIANLRQLLDRLAPPEMTTRQTAEQIWRKYQRLSYLYAQMNMLEWSRDARLVSSKYMDRVLAEMPPDSAERKQFGAQIESYKEEAGQIGVARFQQVELAVKSGQISKPQQVGALLQIGFHGKAVKLAREIPDADWPAGSLWLRVEMASVLVAGGRLPEAEDELVRAEALLKNATDPSAPDALNRFNAALRTFWQVTGNWVKFGEFLDQNAPKTVLSPADRTFLQNAASSPQAWQFATGGGAHGAVGGFAGVMRGQDVNFRPIQVWSQTTEYSTVRGMVSIFEGDIPAAKARLKEALSPGGVPLPPDFPTRPLIEKYLSLIARAEAKP